MKKAFFVIVALIIGFFLFVSIIESIGLENVLNAIFSLSWLPFVLLLIIHMFFYFWGVLRWKYILKVIGEEVNWSKLFPPFLIGNTVSYLTPIVYFGGEPLRAYLLKQGQKVSWHKGVASIALDKVFDLAFNWLVIVLGLFFFLRKISLSPLLLGLIIFVLLGLFFLLYLFFAKSLRKEGFFSFFVKLFRIDKIKSWDSENSQFIQKVEYEISNFFNWRRMDLWTTFILTLARGLFYLLRAWFLIWALGYTLSFANLLIVVGLGLLIFLIPIPASLGSYEFSQSYIFYFLGLPMSMGVAFSLILRGVEILSVGLGLIFIFILIIKGFSFKLKKITDKIVK